MNQILVPGVGMKVFRCAHACPVQAASIQRVQACRLRGVRPFTAPGRRCRQLIRSAAPGTSGDAAGTATQEGPRCYLEPADDGEGLVEICLTEGKLDIGIADSDYYFTAFTGFLRRLVSILQLQCLCQGGHLRLLTQHVPCAVSERQLKLGVFAKNAEAKDMGGEFIPMCISPDKSTGPWLTSVCMPD